MELFPSKKIIIDLADAEIEYLPAIFTAVEANSFFDRLQKEIPWQHDDIKIFGKVYAQPRLTALFGDEEKYYSYSNIKMVPNIWTPLLLEIKQTVEAITEVTFTTVLLNWYRDGKDSNGWHADNEKELGKYPVIASVSFGAERIFQLKHNSEKTFKKNMLLQNGSLLVMKGATQEFYKHQIPKTTKPIGGRINLTFRIIK